MRILFLDHSGVSRLKIGKPIAAKEIPEILNNLGSQSKVKSKSLNRWGSHDGDDWDSPVATVIWGSRPS